MRRGSGEYQLEHENRAAPAAGGENAASREEKHGSGRRIGGEKLRRGGVDAVPGFAVDSARDGQSAFALMRSDGLGGLRAVNPVRHERRYAALLLKPPQTGLQIVNMLRFLFLAVHYSPSSPSV